MKKFLALIIALVMALSLVACGEQKQPDNPDVPDDGQQTATVKVGFITLHDENSTYDLNFINAAKEAIANLGLTDADYILKTNVPEGQECYETAMNLVDEGCNIIFADSFGHEPYMIDAAKEHPEVQFNLSHTRGAVLVGIHDRPIGVDIERIRPVSERTMQRLAGAVTEREFFESWTRRESRAKWGGAGLAAMKREASPTMLGERFEYIETFPGYVACVCTHTDDALAPVRRFTLGDIT